MLSLWSILPQDDMETKNIHGQEKKKSHKIIIIIKNTQKTIQKLIRRIT